MARLRHLNFSQSENADYWPGFVDALATLLLVIVFLLAVFTAGQFALSQALTGRDEQLARLNERLLNLGAELNIATSQNQQLRLQLTSLETQADELNKRNTQLVGQIADLESDLTKTTQALLQESTAKEDALNAVIQLENQVSALRTELSRLNDALNASEAREAALDVEVINLGKRLNAALASQVARLAAYRSEFFGRLMEILDNRSGVSQVGDRFVFETDVLFDSGSASLSETGMQGLKPIADAIVQLTKEIPTDLDWIIRVDGHTDRLPMRASSAFASNWELSTARSISVITYFESQGVPSKRLLAAGFGEHYPIKLGNSPADYARNRRIELKLTDR